MNKKTQQTVNAAMFAAIIFVLTRIVSIPSFTSVGNVNLGDCAVLIAAWLLPCKYGFFAAGIGSVLADITSAYAVYAPATFIIKGLMVLGANIIFTKSRLKNNITKAVISGVVAELIMIVGYLAFESLLYGVGTAILNIPFNGVQGVAGLVSGVMILAIFKKFNIKR